MIRTLKKTIIILIVLAQLLGLAPALQLPVLVSAEETASDGRPILNPVIEGTVRFGSFNYMGDKGEGNANDGDERDGVDYVSTFYYSDDHFSRSAVNPNVTAKTMDWTALEDISMATLSLDFTIACYGSSENTFPTVWANKDKNGKRFLTDCGFQNLFTSADFNIQTGKDTLGYLFGSKEITVYDQKTKQNKSFTLVAVGVRGGGYGAEWSSNLTIGDSNGNAAKDKSYSGTYRHKGFNDGAQMVLADLRTYLSNHNITGNVKYWVCGYSRAGAIANLVAGDLTTNASRYQTSIDDVYGYTFEAAAGALKSEESVSGTRFPNIHNIINAMDAVPLVSPGVFNHCHLGVDYRVPYYGNTTTENNTSYYNRMRTVLPAVAAIADIYNKNVTGRDDDKTEDAVITVSDPSTYPYNRPIQIKSFGITNFNSGFVEDVSNSNSKIAPSSGLYLDTFLSKFVDAFMKCIAWDYEYFYTKTSWGVTSYYTDKMTNDPYSHEQQYVKNYQEALRTLAYHALKNPGMNIGALEKVMDNAMNAIDFETIWNGAGIAAYYAEMNTGIRYNRAVDKLITPMTTVVNKVIDETGLFETGDLPEVHAAIRTIMPVLTWLYCEDHSKMNGEYLGTVFDNVNKILVTHIPELELSWLLSLDDMFISDYREITVPKATEIRMFEFRSGIDDTFTKTDDVESTADAKGAEVASVDDGELTTKDARIKVIANDDMITIRYPGNLDLRLDISPKEGTSFEDINMTLNDYAPANVVNVKSDCTRATVQSSEYNVSNITDDAIIYEGMVTEDITPDAYAINSKTQTINVPLTDAETLHLMTWHGSNQVQNQYDTTYDISLDRAPKTVVSDYSTKTVLASNVVDIDANDDGFSVENENLIWTAPDKNMMGGSDLANATDLSAATYSIQSETKETATAIKTRQKQTVIPASSIYYDDELTDGTVRYQGDTTRMDWDDASGTSTGKTFWYKFTGTRIDVYSTTLADAGFAMAAITDESGNIVTIDGDRKIITVQGQSDTTRYNVPTISFDGLNPNTPYYLKMFAVRNSNYQIDGIRVYHSADETTEAVRSAYQKSGEQDAKYVNLRKLLLGSVSEDSLSGNQEEGAVFYTDKGTSYELNSDEYKTNSPKNEIYLASNESVAFQIVGNYEKVEIGLSAPESRTDGGTVTVTDGSGVKTQQITSALDQYYRITPSPDGSVVIRNTGSAMIAITNVKLSGTYIAPEGMPTVSGSSGPLRVSKALLQYAADFDVPGDTTVDSNQSEETVSSDSEASSAITARLRSLIAKVNSMMSRLFGKTTK